jgi:hypothetical protein
MSNLFVRSVRGLPLLVLLYSFATPHAAAQQAPVEVIYLTEGDLASGKIPELDRAGITLQDLRAFQLHLLNNNPMILNSTEGMFLFFYASAIPLYLTIGAERPGVGFTFVAQNLYVAAALTLAIVAIRFDLALLGITNGVPWPPGELLRIYFHYANMPSPAPPPQFQQFDLPVDPLDDDGSNEYGDPTGPEPPIDDPTPQPNLNSPITESTHYGCSVPNVDLDSGTNPPSPTYAGDQNACGPAAASNSMKWLASTFPGISIPFSHRALLDSLSRYMGRLPNSGVNIQTFVRGKLDFIRTHNLPINVKFQAQGVSGNIVDSQGETLGRNDNTGPYPTWQFLKQEMADTEDVEIFYKWFDGTDWRGHAVTVTGVYETADGKKYVGIKHDVKQRDTGGTVQEFPEVTVDSHGRMILHRHGRTRYISHIISESPGSPFTVTGLRGEGLTPESMYLAHNYPNPFNPSTIIRFVLHARGHTTLKVYDMLGREVAILVDEMLPPGSHEVRFSSASTNLSSGIYYYRLVSGGRIAARTMVLMK